MGLPGLWAMGLMTGLGLFALLLPQGSELFMPVAAAAAVCAFVVAVYDGFLLTSSPAIPIWNTALMPVLCMFYAFLGGTTMTLFLSHFGLIELSIGAGTLHTVEVGLLMVNLIIVLLYLASAMNSGAAGKQSFDLLVRGPYAKPFFILAIGVGLVFTLLISFVSGTNASHGIVAMVTVADLAGHFFLFFLLLKIGVYKPVLGHLRL